MVLAIAQDLIGTPSISYPSNHPEWGQSPEEGFDCSGFVRYILTAAGLTIPEYIGADGIRRPIRHANEFWDHYGIAVHHPLHMPGDLIFFTRFGQFPRHIGIVRDQVSYVHAPGRRDTKVSVANIVMQDIQPNTLPGRQMYTVNPIGYKSPTIPLDDYHYRYHQQPI